MIKLKGREFCLNKNSIKKLVFAFCAIISLFWVFIISSDAVYTLPDANQPDAILIDELTIVPNQAILEGQVIQMQVEEFKEWVLFGSVEWSSSRPDIISCTKDGEIEGLKQGKATITVKAKVGDASDSITVYCAKKLKKTVSSGISRIVKYTCRTPFILNYQMVHFHIPMVFSTGKLDVMGTYGSFYYVEFTRGGKPYSGFIPQNWMPEDLVSNEVFTQLSTYTLNVYVGMEKEQYKVTTDYKGTVDWVVSDENIIEFNETTGKVKGKSPGIATISATVGEKTLVCTVHSIYIWPQEWTGKALKNTYVYKSRGMSYEATTSPLALGDGFTVKGDMGKDSSWVYGVSESGDWGFIPINHLASKGTISQYNGLGWLWPVRDVKNGINQTLKARYITSPYGWRDDKPIKHKGIDITNGISSKKDLAKSADGYEVVSAFAGKVIYVYDISSGYKSCGNCVAIRSNEKDPITGKYYVAIYMHLKSKPNVTRNQNVSANTLLGYIGDTGNSGGSHLHFEVNNQNLSYGETMNYENEPEKQIVFGCHINPLFFYMDYYNLPDDNPEKITINDTCAAMRYRKPLWYGDDIKEDKEP